MSIRRSMPLLFAGALLVWNILLVLLYEQYIAKEWSDWSVRIRLEMCDQLETLDALLAESTDPAAFIATWGQQHEWNVSLQNAQGEVFAQYTHPQSIPKVLPFTESRFIILDGAPTMLTLEQDMAISHVTNLSFIQVLFGAELLLCVVIFVTFVAICNLRLTRPIEQLIRSMENFGRGITPTETSKRDEIGYLHNSFVDLTRQLQDERMAQTQIIASISHDIKTPLTGLMGCAEQLQKDGLPPERRSRYLAEIGAKAQRIQTLVGEFDDYLSFGLSNSLRLSAFSPAQLKALLQGDFSNDLAEMDIRLIFNFALSDAKLLLDIDKIRRLFGNIIDNAVRHIGTKRREIIIEYTLDKDLAIFCVKDYGEGASPETVAHMFDPFYTTDPGRRMAGLGLTTCRRIVQMHGGSIWAETAEPSGLCIFFALPVTSER